MTSSSKVMASPEAHVAIGTPQTLASQLALLLSNFVALHPFVVLGQELVWVPPEVLVNEIHLDLENKNIEEPEDHGVAPFSSSYLSTNPYCDVPQHDEKANIAHHHHDAHSHLPRPLILLHKIGIQQRHAAHDQHTRKAD
ncbi:hypothetical protein DNTS_010866, partial [Danionella cerebrum]